jgi:hypothetical protein
MKNSESRTNYSGRQVLGEVYLLIIRAALDL